jgi:sec-independent protein translocase protein TatB
MLSLPHLVVLFVLALMVFGPEKLPELARMLGKATAEFRKMTNDFRFALEDEVRELERNTRIRDEEIAAAARAAQAPVPMPSIAAAPEGAVPREAPAELGTASPEIHTEFHAESLPDSKLESQIDSQNGSTSSSNFVEPDPSQAPPQAETVSASHEKPSDDNSAV